MRTKWVQEVGIVHWTNRAATCFRSISGASSSKNSLGAKEKAEAMMFEGNTSVTML